MGTYVERHWAPRQTFGLSRRDRAGGSFLAFVPDTLGAAGPGIGVEALSRVADAQSAVARADGIVGESGLFLNHLLLRSESIASSHIEGHSISPKRLAVADALGRGKGDALAVIRNLRAMEYAIDVVAEKWDIDLDDLIELQANIAPHLERGFREEQNWIGGAGYSPLRADFVPPPPEHVVPLLEDLLEYVNNSTHPPLLKAAIAHAQFETIHPFADGNGRTGRALIHAILKRDEVTVRAVLPISTVFSTDKEHYIEGLNAYRDDPPHFDVWVEGFCDAAVRAAGNVIQLKERANELDVQLQARHHEWRASAGKTPIPRADSTVVRVRQGLMARPVETVDSLSTHLGVSLTAAENALDELHAAGVLSVEKDHRGAKAAFVSDEHLNLVTLTERSNQAGGWNTASEKSASQLALPISSFRWDAGRRPSSTAQQLQSHSGPGAEGPGPSPTLGF